MHPNTHQAKCQNAVYRTNILKLNIRLNVSLRWIFYSLLAREESKSQVNEGKMDGEEKKGKGWCWGGCCHPAVCCLKAHSGVNLLEELESSAGCHLFSTLSTLSLSPSLSPSVNRVISAALVSVLQRHISLSQSKRLY